jgi:hypothetical protein
VPDLIIAREGIRPVGRALFFVKRPHGNQQMEAVALNQQAVATGPGVPLRDWSMNREPAQDESPWLARI